MGRLDKISQRTPQIEREAKKIAQYEATKLRLNDAYV